MIGKNPGSAVSAQFCLGWQTVSHAIALAEQFLGGVAVSDDAKARLAIIVEELVANIVEHGQSPPAEPVMIDIAMSGADIVLTISDGGIAFDPRTIPASDVATPKRGGGAGLALINNWARTIAYQRIDGRNAVTLVIPANG